MIKFILIYLLMFVNLFASIDTSKKAITLANSIFLDDAKYYAQKLKSYDIYIRKTLNSEGTNYYVSYAVNIPKEQRFKELEKINKILPSAYACSDKQLDFMANNPKDDDIFIDKKVLQKKVIKREEKVEKKVEPQKIIKSETKTKLLTKKLPNEPIKEKKRIFVDNKEKTIKIALVGPLTGKYKSSGDDMVKAVQIKISQINNAGGIDNRQLELLTFDDQNNKELASKMALKAADSEAVAVIGHRWSSTTAKGIEVYKKEHIVVISGTATSTDLTKDNDWFFRAVPSNAQEVQTLAYYLKYVLNKNEVVVIYDESSFSKNLYDEFVKVANGINLKVNAGYMIDKNSDSMEDDAKKIVTEIKEKYPKNGIFLATHANQAVPVVYQIREQNIKTAIVGSSAIAKVSFAKSFNKYPLELGNKGYYTNDIFCAVPMLFDIGGNIALKFQNAFKEKFKKEFEKKYGAEVNAANASYYDAVSLITKTLHKIDLNQPLKDIRVDIQKQLLNMNRADLGIEGVTGRLYFQPDGNLDKKAFIAKFQKQIIASSLVQINDISNIAMVNYIDKNKHSKTLQTDYPSILKTKTGYLTKKEIVKIGFKLHKISEIDLIHKTAKLNFDLWIIDRGKLSLDELYFSNAIDEIKLDKPVKIKRTASELYRRYNIEAKFAIDFDSTKFNVNQHLVGFTFAVKRRGNQELQLVPDILNLKYYNGKEFVDDIKKTQVFDDEVYKVRKATFYQDLKDTDALANPLLTQIGISEYKTSNVNLFIIFDEKSFDAHSYIPYKYSGYIVFIACFMIILFNYIRNWLEKKNHITSDNLKVNFLFFGINVILVYIILFAAEVFVLEFAKDYVERTSLETIALVINIIRIMINATLVNGLLNHILWHPMSKRSKKEVPALLKNMVSFLIYLAAFLMVYKYILFQDLTSLLASMGVLAMVIGFAVQANINNIFSGLALNIENSIEIGDWIEFTGYPEGQVVEINWRTTTVKCRDGRLVNIPNAVASESPLTNFSKSSKLKQVIFVDINMKHNPEKVKAILLNATKDIQGILSNPAPETGLKVITEWEVKYKIIYNIDEYDVRNDIEQEIWTNIWIGLREAGIEPSVKKSEVKLIDTRESSIVKMTE